MSGCSVVKLYKSPLAVLVATSWLPRGIAGIAIGPLVLLVRKRFADQALRAHELVHVRQFYRSLGLFPVLYLLWPAYRLRCEVEAYRVQVSLQPNDAARGRLTEQAAAMLATHYCLRISKDCARAALTR